MLNEKQIEMLTEKYLGKQVYITSSLRGFFNRDEMKKTLNVDFSGVVDEIKPEETNPLYVKFDVSSSVSLNENHLVLIDEVSPEEAEENLKYALIFKVQKEIPAAKVQGRKMLDTWHVIADTSTVFAFSYPSASEYRELHKELMFSTKEDAETFLQSDRFKEIYEISISKFVNSIKDVYIESFYVK